MSDRSIEILNKWFGRFHNYVDALSTIEGCAMFFINTADKFNFSVSSNFLDLDRLSITKTKNYMITISRSDPVDKCESNNNVFHINSIDFLKNNDVVVEFTGYRNQTFVHYYVFLYRDEISIRGEGGKMDYPADHSVYELFDELVKNIVDYHKEVFPNL